MPGLAAQARIGRRRNRPEVRMVPGTLRVDGRRLRFAVSETAAGGGAGGTNGANSTDGAGPTKDPIWAVNIHGYFAGGAMYWRESIRLAERLGWRVVNPSLPGFGGSDPLDWRHVSLPDLADQLHRVLHHVGAGPVVVLGHSMGGAVGVQYAAMHPGRTLGIVYRDGVATPAWRHRHGILPSLISPLLPDVAAFADMGLAIALDIPDLLAGRLTSTVRALLPDFGRNLQTVGRTLPVGTMLMTVDLRPEIRDLHAQGVPILPVWGCFDRLVTEATAEEFSRCAHTPVVWVPGGHSWMLARPRGQADLLAHLPAGRQFVADVEERWRRLAPREVRLRAVG